MVDKFYDQIEVSKNYFFANATVKNANKNYSNVKNNFELILTKDSLIQKCTYTNVDFPKIETVFETISKLKTLPVNTLFNINGICYEVKGLQNVVAKSTGHEYKKRDIVLIDSSNETITLTLWKVLTLTKCETC